ncbi:hypothetical protein B0H17DRAFT_1031164 [Mycena rosella]|uniref:Transmembrane protein n=1 Tax=Mycena rosella TaxID=1033263 RepID=A0AAD7H067_MYCRO|nr:hypothetical protein B0H17DRAFT_1031164 [Mycena rosella]
MPTLNVTIDDASPLIVYGAPGAWQQNSSNDAYNGGYTSTSNPYATATLEFTGTWVAVNGSKNMYHGAYNVSLDGYPHALNGWTSDDTSFQTEIFNSGPLESGPHTLIISNIDSRWMTLDIDAITWSCDLGAPNASDVTLQNTTVDDTNQAFTYFPHGSWDMNPANVASFAQKTGHSTSLANASVNYTFSGDAVSIYGTTGPQNSQYTVLPGDRPPQMFTATRDVPSSKVLLYFGDQFGPGNHTITLVNQNPGGLLQIDYAVVHAVTSPSSSSAPGPTTSSGTPYIPGQSDVPSPHASLPAGAIVAIAFAALAFGFLVAALWLLLRRNKTLWMRLQRGYMVQSQFDVATPPNGAVIPLPFVASPRAGRSKTLTPPIDDDESFEAPPLGRPVTMQSTASTLVADHGSLMTQVNRFSLKPLRLASRWGPGTPASSQAHLSRSPSARHLLREESEYYDPEAAAVQGIEEVPEHRVDDVLRHPIQRNEPSTYQWQSALP